MIDSIAVKVSGNSLKRFSAERNATEKICFVFWTKKMFKKIEEKTKEFVLYRSYPQKISGLQPNFDYYMLSAETVRRDIDNNTVNSSNNRYLLILNG